MRGLFCIEYSWHVGNTTHMALENPQTQYRTSDNLKSRGNLHSKYAKKNWFAWAAEHMDMPSGSDVLDVGCGGGWFWASTANYFPDDLNITLVDQSDAMVAEAVRNLTTGRHAKVSGKTADVTKLPFADNSFDRVIAMHMMYHVPDTASAISELHRVLRPDGALMLTTNGIDNMRGLFDIGAQCFGGDSSDPAAAIFNAKHGRDLLTADFADISVQIFDDTYEIDDGADIYQYLTSFPPGSQANVTELDKLGALIDQRLGQGGGMLKVQRESALISGRKQA